MRTNPQALLQGMTKFLTVTLAAAIAGALIGVALAKLTEGDDGQPAPSAATAARSATTATTRATIAGSSTATTSTTGATTATTSTTGTTTAPVSGTTTPAVAGAAAPVLVPNVLVLSADLVEVAGTPSRIVTQVRVTNRADSPLEVAAPALVVGATEVPMSSEAAASPEAGPLVRSIPAAQSVVGVLRFTITEDLASQLRETRRAQLRIANRIVVLRITT